MAAISSFTSSSTPEQGQLVEVRQRRFIVADVKRSVLPARDFQGMRQISAGGARGEAMNR
jgi:hypothetical protein